MEIENSGEGKVKKFTGRIPTPIIPLSAKAKKWYTAICKELIEVDGFISPDVIVVSQFCKTLDLYISVCERLKDADDCVQVFENKTSNISGDFTAYNKLHNMLKDLAPQIGIGIRARNTLRAFVHNQLTFQFGEDAWADIQNTSFS